MEEVGGWPRWQVGGTAGGFFMCVGSKARGQCVQASKRSEGAALRSVGLGVFLPSVGPV